MLRGGLDIRQPIVDDRCPGPFGFTMLDSRSSGWRAVDREMIKESVKEADRAIAIVFTSIKTAKENDKTIS